MCHSETPINIIGKYTSDTCLKYPANETPGKMLLFVDAGESKSWVDISRRVV